MLLYTIATSVMMQAQIWTQKSTGFPTGDIAFHTSIANDNVIWTITYQSNPTQQFSKSIDGGNTWTAGSFGLPNTFIPFGITARSATKAWMCGHDGNNHANTGVYVTVDGGTTWTKQVTALFNDANSYPDNIRFFDDNNGIVQGDPIAGGSFEIYKTSDAGITWVRVPNANLPTCLAGEFGTDGLFDATPDGSTLWFASTSGTTWLNRLYKSVDYGTTWTVADLSVSIPFSFTFKNATTGYIVGRVGSVLSVLKTVDGGTTFSNITTTASGLPSLSGPPIVKVIPNTNTLIYAEAGTIGRTYFNNNPDSEVGIYLVIKLKRFIV